MLPRAFQQQAVASWLPYFRNPVTGQYLQSCHLHHGSGAADIQVHLAFFRKIYQVFLAGNGPAISLILFSLTKQVILWPGIEKINSVGGHAYIMDHRQCSIAQAQARGRTVKPYSSRSKQRTEELRGQVPDQFQDQTLAGRFRQKHGSLGRVHSAFFLAVVQYRGLFTVPRDQL